MTKTKKSIIKTPQKNTAKRKTTKCRRAAKKSGFFHFEKYSIESIKMNSVCLISMSFLAGTLLCTDLLFLSA